MQVELINKLKKEFEHILKNKEIFDIIIFGSSITDKLNPTDIDIAFIYKNENKTKLDKIPERYHISQISYNDFFENVQ